MSHTPKPWTVYVRAQTEGECEPGIWIYNETTGITVVDTGAYDVWPLSDADRRLIAAAPELLEACECALRHPFMPTSGPTRAKLQAAIAKATD